MFNVIKSFTDIEDSKHVYYENDTYPRKENVDVTKERIEALSTINNKRNEQLISRKKFSDMGIGNLVQFANLYEIKIPKGSKKDDIVALLESNFNE